MSEILGYTFFQHALIGAVLGGVACGVVGTYMVCRRMLFLGGGITHSSLGGIGIAHYLGLSTTLGALVFAILSAFGIHSLSSRSKKRKATSEDSAISVVWSAGMSVGIIFLFLTPGYAPNLMTYLFGNLLLTSSEQLVYLALFDFGLILLFALWGRSIIFAAMDSEFAASQGIRVKFINCVMLVVMSLCVVLCISILGIMLLLSMLTLPVLVARQFSHSYGCITLLSCLFATLSAIAGLFISYIVDVPTSPVIVGVLVVLWGIAVMWRGIFLRRAR